MERWCHEVVHLMRAERRVHNVGSPASLLFRAGVFGQAAVCHFSGVTAGEFAARMVERSISL